MSLVQAFEATNNPVEQIRKNAEAVIAQHQTQPAYPSTIVHILADPSIPVHIKQAAAISLKNFVKRTWTNEPSSTGTIVIPEDQRSILKAHLVNLMLSSDDKVRAQVLEAVKTIAVHDWPAKWDSLLPELVSKLNTTDFNVLNGVLKTIHSVVRRFRHEFRSQALFKELKYTLNHLQEPVLTLFNMFSAAVDANAQNVAVLTPLFAGIKTLLRIFYDLTVQELPDYFVEHLPEWMAQFNKFLLYNNPLLLDEDDEVKSGPIESCHACICHNLELFAEKYEEDFQPYVQGFVTAIWTVLQQTQATHKYDKLVTAGIRFLTAMANSVHHAVFSDPSTLQSILSGVVMRNITFTDADEEQFEDNAAEYIRRDIEGSDTDTRRRACCELVRALSGKYQENVSALCTGYIQALLAQYATNPQQQWKAKDSAIYLVTALAVRTQTAASGATSLTGLVDVQDFLQAQILPELATDPQQMPVLKADAIKFVSAFRALLPPAGYVAILPMLVNQLSSRNVVVHSYAANAIERLMTAREHGQLKITSQDLQPLLANMIGYLFGALALPDSGENMFVMKALMRVISTAGSTITPYAQTLIEQIHTLIVKCAGNPNNHLFIHYVFEALSALVKSICPQNPTQYVPYFESFFFPTFNQILSSDVQELMVYVFQIMSMLMELNAPGAVNTAYAAIFPSLLSAVLWEKPGNIPGLVRLVQAYIKMCPELVSNEAHLTGMLGVFQKLIASKLNDHFGFYILDCIFESLPLAAYQKFMVPIVQVLFARLNSARTAKFVRCMIINFSILVVRVGGQTIVDAINAVQNGVFVQILQNVWIPDVCKVIGADERKLCAVALTKLLCETPAMLDENHFRVWPATFNTLFKLIELPEEETAEDQEEADRRRYLEVEDTPGYSTAFSQLHNARVEEKDPVPEVTNVKAYVALSFNKLTKQFPGRFTPTMQQDAACLQALMGYFQQTQLAANDTLY